MDKKFGNNIDSLIEEIVAQAITGNIEENNFISDYLTTEVSKMKHNLQVRLDEMENLLNVLNSNIKTRNYELEKSSKLNNAIDEQLERIPKGLCEYGQFVTFVKNETTRLFNEKLSEEEIDDFLFEKTLQFENVIRLYKDEIIKEYMDSNFDYNFILGMNQIDISSENIISTIVDSDNEKSKDDVIKKANISFSRSQQSTTPSYYKDDNDNAVAAKKYVENFGSISVGSISLQPGVTYDVKRNQVNLQNEIQYGKYWFIAKKYDGLIAINDADGNIKQLIDLEKEYAEKNRPCYEPGMGYKYLDLVHGDQIEIEGVKIELVKRNSNVVGYLEK